MSGLVGLGNTNKLFCCNTKAMKIEDIDPKKHKVWVFDIDGTIVSEDEFEHVRRGVISLFKLIRSFGSEYKIYLFTARKKECIKGTIEEKLRMKESDFDGIFSGEDMDDDDNKNLLVVWAHMFEQGGELIPFYDALEEMIFIDDRSYNVARTHNQFRVFLEAPLFSIVYDDEYGNRYLDMNRYCEDTFIADIIKQLSV